MEVLVAKLITLAVLFIITVVLGCLPYFLILRGSRSLISNRMRDTVLACLNSFAGGVFLGTLFLHLMVEGQEEFETYKKKIGWDTEFPYFNIFMIAGFFLVALIEHFMHCCLHSHAHEENEGNRQNLLQHEVVVEASYHKTERTSTYGSLDQGPGNNTALSQNGNRQPHLTEKCFTEKHEESIVPEEPTVICHPGNGAQLQHCHNVSHTSKTQGFLLLMALSFHTLFDGLAVGLQTESSEVWQVFGAIAVHKSIIAFCLGFEIFKNYTLHPLRAFMWMLVFAVVSPLGIGLGIILTSDSIDELAKSLASSILQGAAAGAFLYVTFLEILCGYMGHNCVRGTRFIYILCAAVGLAAMAVVKAFDNE